MTRFLENRHLIKNTQDPIENKNFPDEEPSESRMTCTPSRGLVGGRAGPWSCPDPTVWLGTEQMTPQPVTEIKS